MFDLRTEVLNALHWNLAIPRYAVSVAVSDGWVVLAGAVDRAYERSYAEADTRRVPGVLGVSNDIVVGPGGARHSMRG